MNQRILLEEIKAIYKMLDNNVFLQDKKDNKGPYPDILPTILHKLKNKLTPILGYSQILQMKNSNDSLRNKIDKIERNASELTELFENLKDSLVIRKPVKKRTDLNELLLGEKELFDIIRENGVTISMNIDTSIPLASINHRQISLLLHSIVQNSLSAIGEKKFSDGKIEIRTSHSNGQILLKIRDNGIGIDSSDIGDIWNPFFSRFPGRGGVGLLTVEKVMSDHEGIYTVDSKKGKFSEFTFFFPVISYPAKNTRSSSPLNKIRTLFINFDKDEIEMIKEITGETDSIRIDESSIENIIKKNSEDLNYDIVFFDANNEKLKNGKSALRSLLSLFTDSEKIFFYKGRITDYMLDFINEKKLGFVSGEIKILKIIHLLTKAVNKEE